MMKRYKPAIFPVLSGMLLIMVLFMLLSALIINLDEYLPFSYKYLVVPVNIVGGIVSFILLPLYYINTFYTVSAKVVTAKTGLIISAKSFMPISSVRSVTTILVPLGNIFGFNIVILNAQGSSLVIPFIPKRDAKEISVIINNAISKRDSDYHPEEEEQIEP
jgi:membrane protein YdbS with pleckstrin-like domain